jgi:hypothetical protein
VKTARVPALEDMAKTRTRHVRPPERLAPPPDPDQLAFAQKLCSEVEVIDDPLTLELWVSSLAGEIWDRRRRHGHDDVMGKDPGFEFAAATIEAIADVGGQGAKIALLAIAELADYPERQHAKTWAATIEDASKPPWFAKIGKARVVQAAVAYWPCEAELVVFEAEQRGFGRHALMVDIDNLHGGAATDIELHDTLESAVAPLATDFRGMDRFQSVDPALACRRTLCALWLTDDRPGLRVGERYAELQEIALTRACTGPRRPR